MRNRFLIIAAVIGCFAFFSSNGAAAQCAVKSRDGVHVVQKGENLFRIAKKYGLTLDELCAMNGLSKTEALPECAEIKVKKGASAAKPSAPKTSSSEAPRTGFGASETKPSGSAQAWSNWQAASADADSHLVQEGETVADIAFRYGYAEWLFRDFNHLGRDEYVPPGRLLRKYEPGSVRNRLPSEQPPGLTVIESKPLPSGAPSSSPSAETGDWSIRYDNPEWDKKYGQTSSPQPSSGEKWSSSASSPVASAPAPSGATTEITKPMPIGGPSKLPTAPAGSRAAFMSADENKMLDEINLLRTDPAGYVPYVEEYIAELRRDGNQQSSIAAAQELIGELKKMPRLSFLEPQQCLFTAAVKHGKDQKPTGDLNHQGTDGAWPWDRVLRECKGWTDGNENLVGGPSDIRRSVMLLLVDDGIDNRGHRRTLLEPNWKFAACHKVGTVGSMPNCWIQLFGY